MNNKILFHGSKEVVKIPEIRPAKYNKDFYYGFYCTLLKIRRSDGQRGSLVMEL